MMVRQMHRKHYTTVYVNRWEQITSIDLLKPAHIDSNASEQSDLSMQSTSPFIVPTNQLRTQIQCPLPIPPVMVVVLIFPTISLIVCETLERSYVVVNSFFFPYHSSIKCFLSNELCPLAVVMLC